MLFANRHVGILWLIGGSTLLSSVQTNRIFKHAFHLGGVNPAQCLARDGCFEGSATEALNGQQNCVFVGASEVVWRGHHAVQTRDQWMRWVSFLVVHVQVFVDDSGIRTVLLVVVVFTLEQFLSQSNQRLQPLVIFRSFYLQTGRQINVIIWVRNLTLLTSFKCRGFIGTHEGRGCLCHAASNHLVHLILTLWLISVVGVLKSHRIHESDPISKHLVKHDNFFHRIFFQSTTRPSDRHGIADDRSYIKSVVARLTG